MARLARPHARLLALVLTALAAAGCGSSSSSGGSTITLGAEATGTAAAVATATAAATATTSSATPSTPKTGPLSKEPKVVPPKGAAPTHLIIKDLIVGTGAPVTANSTVTVNYVGVLYHGGKIFDASWNHGMPLTLPADRGHSRLDPGPAGNEGGRPA